MPRMAQVDAEHSSAVGSGDSSSVGRGPWRLCECVACVRSCHVRQRRCARRPMRGAARKMSVYTRGSCRSMRGNNIFQSAIFRTGHASESPRIAYFLRDTSRHTHTHSLLRASPKWRKSAENTARAVRVPQASTPPSAHLTWTFRARAAVGRVRQSKRPARAKGRTHSGQNIDGGARARDARTSAARCTAMSV